MRNRKAAGQDKIPPEVCKPSLTPLIDRLHKLYRSIWECEIFPNDLGESIPKKDEKTVCENYTGVSTVEVTAKISCVLFLNRFANTLWTKQRGIGCDIGYTDQIFTLRRELEHCHKFKQLNVARFIEFRTAFDSFNREPL